MSALPALDFELLFAALPAPHLVLGPDGTVLALNTALTNLLDPAAPALAGQPLGALREAFAAAGLRLAPAAAWATGLAAAQAGHTQVLAPLWEPEAATATYWQATLQPVPVAGELRYLVGRLLDVSEQLRRDAESAQRLARILAQTPALLATLDGPEHRYSFTNPGYDALVGHRARLGQPAATCFPELQEQGFIALLDQVYRTGEAFMGREVFIEFADPAPGQAHQYYLDFTYQALRDDQGLITGVLAFIVDMTPQVLARREAEALQAAMLATDQRLRRQAEILPIITFTTDAAGHSTYISPQWYHYTGQPTGGPPAAVDAMWDDALHPDDRARAQREVRASVAEARQRQVEVRLRGTDGQYRWFLTDAVPELDAEGRLLRRFGYMLDVHELREAQGRLEAKDQQLSQILEQAPAFIATFEGPDHRYTFFNPNYRTLLGYHARLGQAVAQSHPDAVAQGFVALLDGVYQTGETFVGLEMPTTLRPLGTDDAPRLHYFDYTFVALRSAAGSVQGVLSFAVDVTERVLARQHTEALTAEVRRRDEQVQAITASVPVFIFNFDAGGTITYTNPYFYEYTGLDPAAPLNDAWLALPEEDRTRVHAVGSTAMAAGLPWQASFRCRRHDGELRWFQTKVQPYTGADGQLAGFSAATVEIHELQSRTEELARSRTDFAALADNMAQLAWMADPTGYIFWYNQQWYDYTGSNLQSMQGDGWLLVHDPARAEAVLQGYQACIASGEAWEDTFPLRRHDGQYRWFLSRARPVRDAAGQIVRWFGTNTDVTELRQLQDQLAASEEEQRIQAESIPQQVWTAHPDGTLDYYNHRTAAYVGEAMEKNGAAHWLSFVHPDDRALMQERWQVAMTSQRYYEAEFRLRRYDGQYRWFLGQAQARRTPTGQLLKWYGTNTDVHQQRQLQEQVAASQARFKQMLETLPQLAWTARPDGNLNYYNQRWYELTGATFDELRDWGWEQFIHPDDYAETLRRWQHSIATGAPFDTELRWRDRHGHYRWFLARGEAVRDPAGAVVLWVGTNTDVHEFKQVQQQLEAQNDRLRRTNDDLDNFVYTASHDLKQPINNMAGIFEELTRTAYFRDPDAVKLISYFENALARIFDTIDDLGAIVQVQRQHQELPVEDVELAPLVAEVIGSLQDQVSLTGAAIELDFATCPVVSFVRAQLQSLFFNLLSNSLRYAAPGRPPRIRLSSTPDALTGRPILTVADNGLGIDLARFGPQLFQLFRRFHSHVEGTGMGLYLVNRIVQNHGGRLEVSSVVDEGTTFRVYL